MSGPKQQSGSRAGEMQTAAKMHGTPLLKMNNLSRWYLRSGFVLILGLLLHSLSRTLGLSLTANDIMVFDLWIHIMASAFLMVSGGIGIKFFPSSLGGAPHVHSSRMSLWSYWLILVGIFLKLFVFLVSVMYVSDFLILIQDVISFLGSVLLFIGATFLTYNLWRTMENRVN